MSQYYKLIGADPFEVLPLTFHIEHGLKDPEFERFRSYFQSIEKERKSKTAQLEKLKSEYIAKKLKKEGSSHKSYCFSDEDDEEEAL